MIPDERLEEMIAGIRDYDNNLVMPLDETIDALTELLSLREQKRKLIDDSNKLAEIVDMFCREAGHPDINDDNGDGVLHRHKSLMKELEVEG